MTAEILPILFCRQCFHTVTHRKEKGQLICQHCGKANDVKPVLLSDKE